MTFWMIAGVLALIAAFLVGRVMLRPPARMDGGMEQVDIQVYRDQLQSVEKDLARGVVAPGDAERLRTEIKRRILDADKARSGPMARAPRNLSLAAAALAGVAIIGGSFWVYQSLGAPGYPDQPMKKRLAEAEELRAGRPGQAEAERMMPATPAPEVPADYAELIGKLRDTVAERPDDLAGWQLLARQEAQIGNLTGAYAAQRRVIDLKGDAATAQDYATYATMMVQAAGGLVSAEAVEALSEARSRNPADPIVRYFTGLLYAQTGRPDLTFQIWEPLLREGPPDAPWSRAIHPAIEEIAAMAGIRYQAPPAPTPPIAGPTAEDMAAAAEMTGDDREQMIRGMVDQLSERLASQGGTPDEWAQLIQALGVLGETERAAAIWGEAQQVFPDPATLAPIRRVAEQSGLAGNGLPEPAPAANAGAAGSVPPAEAAPDMDDAIAQLAARLETQGGPATDWAMLIRSLGVMGNRDEAAAAWEKARAAFADPEQLNLIREAARAAGVTD
ncbi:c-type cytochrome biogenesis protein CcmI [Tropicimonas sp.]|uniref:c-type cytochrome biogenesis protein CcmI n=1 Tax=Tropicimonas sp. TaxID=2067044 RepID=UPI003A8BA814